MNPARRNRIEKRLERARANKAHALRVLDNIDEIGITVAAEWAQWMDDDEEGVGICDDFIDAARFAVDLKEALDPLVVLPEPADSVADGAVAVTGFVMAMICQRSPLAMRKAPQATQRLLKEAERQISRADRLISRLTALLA